MKTQKDASTVTTDKITTVCAGTDQPNISHCVFPAPKLGDDRIHREPFFGAIVFTYLLTIKKFYHDKND